MRATIVTFAACLLVACSSTTDRASKAPQPSASDSSAAVATEEVQTDAIAETNTPCTAAVTSAAAWGLGAGDLELTPFADAFLKQEVTSVCEATWKAGVRRCFGQATDIGAVESCKASLDRRDLSDLTSVLADVQARLTVTASLEANADCTKAVSAHYGDPAWIPHLERLDAKLRKKAIGGARALMTKACRDEQWNASQRACLVASAASPTEAGVADREAPDEQEAQRLQCFEVMGKSAQWTYPPESVIVTLGRCGSAANHAASQIAMSADVQARMAIAITAACEKRRWDPKRLECLLRADGQRSVHACLQLEPTDELVPDLYEPRNPDGFEQPPEAP